jgi:hypothetical protein
MLGCNGETRGRFCNDLGSSIVVPYSVGPIISLHDRITAREYVDRLGNQVRPMIQMLLPNMDALLQSGKVLIHITGTVESWFEEHEGKLQHRPWPAQLPNLNITGPLWSVLETTVRNRFPSPISLKQLADVLQEEWYKISLQTVHIRVHFKKDCTILKAKGGL